MKVNSFTFIATEPKWCPDLGRKCPWGTERSEAMQVGDTNGQ